MNKLDPDIIKRIQAYPPEVTNTDVGKELGVTRQTVARYRKGVADVLEKKEPEETKKPSKEELEKQEIVRSYSPQELKEILAHLQTNTNKSIDKIIGDK